MVIFDIEVNGFGIMILLQASKAEYHVLKWYVWILSYPAIKKSEKLWDIWGMVVKVY